MQELHTPEQAAQWLRSRVKGALRTDSRQLLPGDGLLAWPGAKVDARSFVAKALQGGMACLVEHEGAETFTLFGDNVASYGGLKADAGRIAADFYGVPSARMDVVAVTGTNGKTSTAWWLAHALSALPGSGCAPCAVVGTLGVGLPPAVQSTGLTTPESVYLQHTLHGFAEQGVKAVAMEASSIGLDEHRLDGTQIHVAIFTNLTQDHLDYHGSMEAYWQSKRRLFVWPGLRSAVINVDDAHGAELAAELQGGALDVWTVSFQQDARVRASNLRYGAQGVSFDVLEGGQSWLLATHMIGTYNVSNMLGVLAAMRALGVPMKDAVRACSDLRPVPGRMECLGGQDAPLVAVDYAHTPDALDQALIALRPLTAARGGKLWCVFGCGGDRDATKRPLMGAIAARQADQVVITSDNPRSEKPEAIIAQILQGAVGSPAVQVQADRAQAIAQSIEHAQPTDVILLAGKGHEAVQEIAGTQFEFSDAAHATAALLARAAAVETHA
ncbi:MAG: UDP-N-acetylmuramoyl-L-alanyl-D-glutamate--2,6-diaminopimelate ligase [Rhodoferax sp.]|nr:UDP-N-acetylmuramoyl-L-alanyl-D-glutamate--2,6-diaminopimelate ligase [Rhodoferax sp.]